MMKLKLTAPCLLAAALAISATTPAFASGVYAHTTFSNDMEGWGALFQTYPDGLGDHRVDEGGTQGMAFRHIFYAWGVQFRNERNRDFLGDYTRLGTPLKFSFDERNGAMEYLQMDSGRGYHLQFLKFLDNGQQIGVSYALDPVESADGWVTHHVIFDPTSKSATPGWRTFNHYGGPDLPDGLTFNDIMRDVDMVRITNFDLDLVYPFSWFAVLFDNITLQSIAIHQ